MAYNHDKEKTAGHSIAVQSADLEEEKADGNVDVGEAGVDETLKRQLRARHASMLAIGGAIGTGLIIGSGTGLARSGPVGLLIAFIYVGSLCFSMMVCLGEMAAFLPHQRGFPGHASRFVGPSFGGTVGFTYYLKYLFATATQFSACAVIISYWIPATKVNSGIWIAIFIVFTASMQFAPVKYFGEFEFWCSTFKIITLTGLMIMALVIDLGGGPDHHRIGFANWQRMPFAAYLKEGDLGRFLGFVSALITAVYSYTGTEMVGIALGEMRNPRRNISRAVRACFYRIIILYCGSIFFVGLIVPADSKLLLAANAQSTTANASPFVVAINVAGIKVLPHIINAAALVFVLSAANSDVYVNSRTAFMMAKDGNLPKFMMTVNRNGTPYIAVATSSLFCCLAFTATVTSAFTVFKYFVTAVTLTSTMVWIGIFWSHIAWRRACTKQGVSLATLPYRNRISVLLSWWGLIGTAIISITKGFDAFIGTFNVTSFITNYIALPVSITAYIVYSYKYKGWYLTASQVDLETEVREWIEDTDEEDADKREPGVLGWIKYVWNS